MKKFLAILVVFAFLVTQVFVAPILGVNKAYAYDPGRAVIKTNLYDYFNGLSTLERRNFLETNIDLFSQFGGTNAYDTFADLLLNNLDASGALVKMGITKVALQNTFTLLAAPAGQTSFRTAFETAVTTQMDAATMHTAMLSLNTDGVITTQMVAYVDDFLMPFFGSLTGIDSHVFLENGGTITMENEFAFLSSVRLLFENQVDMDLLDVNGLLNSYIAVINAQIPAVKAALIADLKGMKLMVSTPAVVNIDIYMKYNALNLSQKTDLSNTLKHYMKSAEVMTAAVDYYNTFFLKGTQNLPNGFGISPAKMKEFIEAVQNPANASKVDSLFLPFSSMNEVAVFARLDAAQASGLMNSQMTVLMKKFWPWLNIYSKLNMPLLNDISPLQTSKSTNVPKLNQFISMLLISDYPDTAFGQIDEILTWFSNMYNSWSSGSTKESLRFFFIYFSVMNGDVIAPIPAFFPVNGSKNVSLSTAITVKFNEPVYRAPGVTSWANCFTISNGGKNVHFTVTASADHKTFTFTPDRLYDEQTYKVSIVPNKLQDAAGNKTSGSATWSTPVHLISFVITTANVKGVVYFTKGGTNTIKFKGNANDKAIYYLKIFKNGKWVTINTKTTNLSGYFTWEWNGKVGGKYLSASKTPYKFKVVKLYNGKYSVIKEFKVVMQPKPSLIVDAPKVYTPNVKKPMGVKVKYNNLTDVKVAVYTSKWKLVKVLYDKKNQKPNSNLVVNWNGKDANGKFVKPGYYYIKTTIGNKVVIKRVLILDYVVIDK